MPLIVDCYNVLHAEMPQRLAGLDENGLCRALAQSPWRGDRIVVVCDGSVKPHTPAVSPVEGVELVYSGPGRSADDVIIGLIDADSAPRSVTVVSSDRQIQKAARKRRCTVIASSRFVHLLAAGFSGQGGGAGENKPAGTLTERETQQWLKRFGVAGADDPDGGQ